MHVREMNPALSLKRQGEIAPKTRSVARSVMSETRTPHLFHVFPSFCIGGVPIRIANVINHWAGHYRHTILATDGRYDAADRVNGNLDVTFYDGAPSTGGPIAGLRHIRRILKDAAPDLLLTYNWGSIDWALANRLSPICPQIHFESGFGPEEADRQLLRRALYRRLALGRAQRLVVPSHLLVDIATNIWKINPRKITLIPNGVDCALFAGAPDAALKELIGKTDDTVVIGTVAPLRAEKNVARLVRAFAALDSDTVRLAIVGDGSERPALENLAAELGVADRVVFTGQVERVERVLGWFDVFALSSDTEQMPNALIQAMAAGCAVAACDVGDVKRIAAPENAPYIVSKELDGGLRDALSQLVGDRDLRKRLGTANRRRAETVYAQDIMFRAYDAVLEIGRASCRERV